MKINISKAFVICYNTNQMESYIINMVHINRLQKVMFIYLQTVQSTGGIKILNGTEK